MDKLQLKAKVRDVKKTKPNKLRKIGELPAVVYGHNLPSQSLTLSLADFEKIFKKAGESTIVDLMTQDGKARPVIIHEVQHHVLTSKPIHVDFYAVSMTEKLKAKVALEFTGESKAVKELGAVLVKVLNEVEMECLPGDLPHNISVNLASLQNVGESIHVKDLTVPAKVKILTQGEEIIVKAQPPRDVEAELSAPVVEDVSKVEGAAEVKPVAEGEATPVEKEEKPEKMQKAEKNKK